MNVLIRGMAMQTLFDEYCILDKVCGKCSGIVRFVRSGGIMEDRDCETCVHAKPFGGWYDNRCDVWECEYINRKEAIEAYKARRDDPLIEIVRCGECKWCETRETANYIPFLYCLSKGISVKDTDYCSWGERRADEIDRR